MSQEEQEQQQNNRQDLGLKCQTPLRLAWVKKVVGYLFRLKFFSVKNFLGDKHFFGTKSFYGPKFFLGPKFLLGQKKLDQKSFGPNFFKNFALKFVDKFSLFSIPNFQRELAFILLFQVSYGVWGCVVPHSWDTNAIQPSAGYWLAGLGWAWQ